MSQSVITATTRSAAEVTRECLRLALREGRFSRSPEDRTTAEEAYRALTQAIAEFDLDQRIQRERDAAWAEVARVSRLARSASGTRSTPSRAGHEPA